MAKLKLKFRDISRMTKKYPYTRHLPRTQLVSDKEFELEVVAASISNAIEHTVTWETQFGGIPNVTVSIAMTSGATSMENDMANVNVWVKSTSATQCTIAFSDNFTGHVNIQAIRFT